MALTFCEICAFSIRPSDPFCAGCGAALQLLSFLPEQDPYVAFLPPRGTGEVALVVENRGTLQGELADLQLRGLESTQTRDDFGDMVVPRNGRRAVSFTITQEVPGNGVVEARFGDQKLRKDVQALPVPRFFPTVKGAELRQREDFFIMQVTPRDGRVSGTLGLDNDRHLDLVVDELDVTSILATGTIGFVPGQSTLGSLQVGFDGTLPEKGEVIVRVDVTCAGIKTLTVQVQLDATESPDLIIDNIGALGQERVIMGLGKSDERFVEIKNQGRGKIAVEKAEVKEGWASIQGFSPVDLPAKERLSCRLLIENDRCPLASSRESRAGEEETTPLHLRLFTRYGKNLEHSEWVTLPLTLVYESSQMMASGGEEMPVAIDFGTTNTCIGYLGDRLTQDDYPSWYTAPSYGVQMHDVDRSDGLDFEFPTVIQFKDFAQLEPFSMVSDDRTAARLAEFGEMAKVLMNTSLNLFVRTAWNFKPLIGTEETFWVWDEQKTMEPERFTPDRLAAIFLTEVLRRFQQASGRQITKLLATFPATFREHERESLRRILAQISGLPNDPEAIVMETSEPLALAMNRISRLYSKGKLNEGQDYFIGVYDFGGGTTDLNLVKLRLEEDIVYYWVLATDGIPVGGEELTFKLSRMLFDRIVGDPEQVLKAVDPPTDDLADIKDRLRNIRYPKKDAREINIPGQYEEWERENFSKLIRSAEELKLDYDKLVEARKRDEPLRFRATVQLNLDDETSTGDIWLELTQPEVDAVLGPHIVEGLDCLNKMATLAKLTPREGVGYFDELLLCGNSSRLKLVQRKAAEMSSQVHFDPVRAKIGVVEGALAAYEMLKSGILMPGDADGAELFPCPMGLLRHGKFRELFPAGADWGNTPPTHDAMTIKVTRFNRLQQLRWQRTPSGNPKDPKTHPIAGEIDLSRYEGQKVQLLFLLKDGKVGCSVDAPNGQDLVFWTPRE